MAGVQLDNVGKVAKALSMSRRLHVDFVIVCWIAKCHPGTFACTFTYRNQCKHVGCMHGHASLAVSVKKLVLLVVSHQLVMSALDFSLVHPPARKLCNKCKHSPS